MKKDPRVTAVIASVGEPSLASTIGSLNSGTIVPYRVLLCVPTAIAPSVSYLKDEFENIEIVSCAVNGQVRQRLDGFLRSRSEYTLQLDSDVVMKRDTLQLLLSEIESLGCVSVGPLIERASTQRAYSFLGPQCSLYADWQKKIILWLLNGRNGFEPGKISRGGVGFGVDPNCAVKEVEWLPGCCILHRTKLLVLRNFYMYDGKAYGEDLFHSHFLREAGVRLFLLGAARVRVQFPEGRLKDSLGLAKGHLIAFRAGWQFVTLSGASRIRFLGYTLFNMTFLFLNRVVRR